MVKPAHRKPTLPSLSKFSEDPSTTKGAEKSSGSTSQVTDSFEQRPSAQTLSQRAPARGAKRALGKTGQYDSLRTASKASARTKEHKTPKTVLQLSGSVGREGVNRPEDVKQVQRALQEAGFLGDVGKPGVIDEATHKAIESYQRTHKLKVVDGRIDVSKSTMKHMNAAARPVSNEAKRTLQGKVGLSAKASPKKASQRPTTKLSLSGSVGRKGKNHPQDVAQVQQALQERGLLGEVAKPGTLDEATNLAIERYQRDNKLKVVDGRIDVQKSTMRKMNREVESHSQNKPLRPQGETNLRPVAVQPSGPLAEQVKQLGQRTVEAGMKEWNDGVRSTRSNNRGDRIDEYAKNARMNPGGAWCGYFAGFAMSEAGFQHPSSLASYQKARDFFRYRSFTSKTNSEKNNNLDKLRLEHQQNGDGRHYFMLEESPTLDAMKKNGAWGKKRYGHVDAEGSTFQYNNLPIQPGDVVLFNRGHVGIVRSYDPATGQLTTVEGNATGQASNGRRRSQAVVTRTFDLSDSKVREQFDGFGRPARADFQ